MFSNAYPPYNYLNEEGELVGFNMDILNAISDLYEEIDIELNSETWAIINKELENKTIQAIGGVHYSGSLENNYFYTRSSINTSHCFLYNTKNHNKFSLEFLRTKKEPLVALWKNDVLVHYILSINPSTKFLYVKNYIDLINSIDREDVTCVFGQRIVSKYYAEKEGGDYVMSLYHRILERNMGFKVSKELPELAEIINNGLEVILANGKYQQIYDKWIADYDKGHESLLNYIKYILFIAILFFYKY